MGGEKCRKEEKLAKERIEKMETRQSDRKKSVDGGVEKKRLG